MYDVLFLSKREEKQLGLWRKMENNFTQPSSSTIYLVSFATIRAPAHLTQDGFKHTYYNQFRCDKIAHSKK